MMRIWSRCLLHLACCWPLLAVAGVEEGIAAYRLHDYATALREFRPLADAGDVRAMSYLGTMYLDGAGVDRDSIEAMKYLVRAAERGDARAQTWTGVAYQEGTAVNQDYAQAQHWYRLAAAQGIVDAQRYLGLMYFHGLGVAVDRAEALKWLKRAADQGHSEAQWLVGVILIEGDGVTPDAPQALSWLRKAAEQRQVQAAVRLGVIYRRGSQGVAVDRDEAVKWFQKASDDGALGEYTLGLLYREGVLVPRDLAKHVAVMRRLAQPPFAMVAAKFEFGAALLTGQGIATDPVQGRGWLERAADEGSVDAQLLLAEELRKGRRLAADPAQAFKLVRRAANQGSPAAHGLLGQYYNWGAGVQRDPLEAVRLMLLASQEGYKPAMEELAELYLAGEGVPLDCTLAVYWLKQAARPVGDVAVSTPASASLGTVAAAAAVASIAPVGANGKNTLESVQQTLSELDNGGCKPPEHWAVIRKLGPGVLNRQRPGDTDYQARKSDLLRRLRGLMAQGNNEARCQLGAVLAQEGVAQSSQLLVEGARKGGRSCMLKIGQLSAQGMLPGVRSPERVAWLTRAAQHGLAYAFQALARTYEQGKDVPQDLVQAYKWSALNAEVRGWSVDETVAPLAARLRPKKVEQAKALVLDWKRMHPMQ